MNKLFTSKGYTLIELLIALFLTGVITTAGFHFYVKMHNSALTQEEISDMQQKSRASLQEIGRTLRMAGYKIGSHDAYRINGDSLYVFYSGTQPVDTVLYFLMKGYYAELTETPSYNLMRQLNSENPVIYSDYVQSIRYNVLNPSEIEIILVVQTTKPDETFDQDDGIRSLTMSHRVSIRNANL